MFFYGVLIRKYLDGNIRLTIMDGMVQYSAPDSW